MFSTATAITGILATTLALALPAPARADQDPGQVSLSSSIRGSALAINSSGKSVPVWYTADAENGASLPPTITATITTSGSSPIQVELSRPTPGCQTSATAIVCRRSPSGRLAPNGDLRLRLTPGAGAAVGDQAHISITVTAPNVETSVDSFTFTLAASGPDLQMNSSAHTVAPGKGTAARPSIRNSGDQVAPTVLLSLYGGSYTRFPVHYRNCHYQTDSYGFEDGVCLLSGVNLAPGETLSVAPSTPFRAQVKANVPGELRLTSLDPPGQPYDTYLAYSVDSFDTTPADDRLSWPLGTGPTLKWHRSSSPAITPSLTEADPWDNYGQEDITVSPSNPTDIAAEGTSVTGAVGDEVTATVGIRNQGPADIVATPAGKGGDPADPYNAGFRFIPPKNTEVENVVLPSGPDSYYQEWYKQTTAQGDTYLVLPFSLAKDQEYTVQFTLRITAAGVGTGSVVGQGGTHDPVSANNTAAVVVTSS